MKIKSIEFKRVTCFILSLLMLFSSINIPVYAAENTYDDGTFVYTIDEGSQAITIIGLTDSGKEATTLNIPETIDEKLVTKIKGSAFYGHKNVETVVIPETITSIGSLAFSNCSVLERVSYNSSATPDAYFTGDGIFAGSPVEDVSLGYGITTIPDFLLAGSTGTDIIIDSKEPIITIGNNAFRNTSALNSITISNDNIAEIQNRAFAYSAVSSINSKNINLENGELELKDIVFIGDSAFESHPHIIEITIPSTVTYIGASVFANCKNLTTVNYNTTANPKLDFTGAGIFAGSPVDTINFGSGITTIPSLISVASSIELTINSVEEITEIKDKAFYNMSNLEKITFTNSNITTIGNNVFQNSNKLTEITDNNISLKDNKLELKNVVSIGNAVFMNMPLEEVTIPSTATTIGASVFADCKNLTTVNYNTTANPALDFAGAGIFAGSPVEIINLGSGITAMPSLISSASSTELVINSIEEITEIKDKAFYNVPNLEKINFSNSNITTIGNSAFLDANKLTEIVDNNISLKDGKLELKKVVSIGNNAFASMNYDEIIIPPTVLSIGSSAFANCPNFTKLTYNTGVTPAVNYANRGAFEGSPIEYVEFNSISTVPRYFLAGSTGQNINFMSHYEITYIGTGAFSSNANLSSVNFNNANITHIGDRAFYNTGLTTYTIPESVTSIGEYAFSDCNNLELVILPHETAPTIKNNAFKNMADDSIIKVKNADVAAVFTNANYSIDKTTIKIGDEYHVIYQTSGNGTITRNGLTDTIISALIESADDLYSVTATPEAGNKFVHWVDANNNIVSTDATLTIDMPTEDESYTAVFERILYTITFEMDSKYGTLTNPVLYKYYGEYINNDEVGININEGYSFNGWLHNGVDAGKVVRVYDDITYTANVGKTLYEYTINIFYNNEVKHTLTKKAELNTVIDTYEGLYTYPKYWKFDKVEGMPITVAEDESSNVMNVYYVTDKENYDTYTVNYFYDNVKEKSIEFTVPKGTVLETVAAQNKDGYAFDRVEGLPAVVTDGIEVNVYYISKDTQQFSYTIEYYYDDVLDEVKTESVIVNAGDRVGTLNTKITANLKAGYEYKSVTYELPADFDGNLYTVLYYYDDVVEKTEGDVNIGDIEDKIQENLKDGYVFVHMDKYSDLVVNSNGITIKVNYTTKVEEEPADEYTYKVEYYYGGELDESATETYTFPAGSIVKGIHNKTRNGTWLLVSIDSVPVTLDKEGIVIKAYYLPRGNQVPAIDSRFEVEVEHDVETPPVIGEDFYTEITQDEHGNPVIKIYYKSDKKEVKTEYYFDGVIDESLTEKETVLKGTVIDEYEDKIKDGYLFDKVENLPLTVNDDDNTIKVYYKSKTAEYTVEYYFDNVLDNTLTEKKTVKLGTVVNSYTDKAKTEYSLDKVEGMPLTVTEDGENVIKVYYKLNKYTYTINYYYDGVINSNLTETGSAVAGTVINTYTDNLKENYVFDKTVNYPLTVSKDGNNVIEVHYKTKTLDYKVEYYFEDVIDNSLTETYNVKVNTVINSYTDKAKTNYILDKVVGMPLTVTDGGNNVIQVYYKLDKVDYRIEYYFDGVIDNTKTENKSDVVNTSITEYTDYSSSTLVFDKVENNPMVLVKDKENVMKVYYKTKVDYVVHYYIDNELDDTLTEITPSYHGEVITTYPDKSNGLTFVKDENVPLTIDKTKDNVIKVYYKTPVSYTVEYYYDNVKDDAKTETGSGYHGDVISSYTDKSSDIYEFVKVMNHPLTLDKTSDNVMKVFYKTKQFTYTVEYFYDGVKDNSKTDTFTVNINTKITSYADKSGEYILDKVEGLPVVIVDNNSVVKVYYKTEMLDYKVEYYFDGILDASKTDIFNVAKGTVINNYKDKAGEYIFDKVENIPLVVSKNSENTIKVYYKTEMINYTVNYYYDGVKDTSKTDVFTVAKNSIITSYTDKSGSYVLDRVIGLPLTVTKGGPNLINVYYVTPAPEQVNYKVEYYYDGILDNSKTDVFTVDENTVITKYIDKAGEYVFDKVENLPLKVVDGESNVIKVFYKTEMIEYTVEYYYNNIIDNSKTDKFTVGKGSVITTYTDKVIENYVFDKVENLPLTVSKNGNNTIKVYYKIDQVSYKVEYYYNNVLDDSKTDTFVVDVNTVVNTYVDKSGSYILDKVENLPLTVVNGGDNKIKVYYVEPIKSYDYKVEYYYNGTINNSFTEIYTVNEGTVITTYTDKANGYNFSRVENLPLTVSSNVANNVIKVYYTKTIIVIPTYYKYTVEYYFDGIIDNDLTDVFNVEKGTTIRTYKDKVKDGYVFDRVEGIPLTVKDNSGVIKVFYEAEDITYKVKYYFDNVIDNDLTETYSVKPGTIITVYVDKIKSGYELDRVINLPLTVEKGKDNVIKVYYEREEVVIPDITYKVEYYYDDVIDNTKTDIFTVAPGTLVTTYKDKVIEGYKFVKVENIPLTVTTTNNVIKVFYEKIVIPPVETTYSVEYYYNNKLEHTDVFNTTVGQIIEWVAERPKADFKKDRTLNLPLTVVEDASKNVIKVYYVRDDVIQTGFPYERVGILGSMMLISGAAIIGILKKKKKRK